MSGTSPDPPPGPAVTIRDAAPDDAAAILAVHRSSILTLGRACYTQAEVDSWAHGLVAERYAEAMTEQGERFLVAEDVGGTVVGFCSSVDDEVRGLYVAPTAARSGIGRAMLARAEAEIATAGHATIRVRASLVGQPFYQASGYAVVEVTEWTTRGGLTITVLEMAEPLD